MIRPRADFFIFPFPIKDRITENYPSEVPTIKEERRRMRYLHLILELNIDIN